MIIPYNMLHHLTAKDVGRGLHGISARNDKHIELKQNISYTPPPHDLLFLTTAQGQLKSINREWYISLQGVPKKNKIEACVV